MENKVTLKLYQGIKECMKLESLYLPVNETHF
jgi:hypothetical protein